MMKKIICLALGLLMVASVLTSCGKKGDIVDDINNKASRLTTTLNLWVITESATVAKVSDLAIAGLDPEKDPSKLTDAEKAQLAALSDGEKQALTQVLRISEKINKITKTNFKTKLNIKYFTEEEYYAKAEQAFVEYKKGGANTNSEEVTKDETVINEYGIPELKYPTADPNQIDVLFIGDVKDGSGKTVYRGFDKYREYVDKEWLLSLNTHLEDDAVIISDYVNQIFLNSVSYKGGKYAVPNNAKIGEYTYVCVKTDVIESLGCNLSDLQNCSIYDKAYYDLFAKLETKYEGERFLYAPHSSGIELQSVHYWTFNGNNGFTIDPATFSIFGGIFSNINSNTSALTKQGDQVAFTNLLRNSTYMENYLQRKAEYEEKYVTKQNANGNSAAICVDRGSWELREEYEKNGYEVLIMENPRANEESVFSSMFAMGADTKDEARAMEIITCLSTNAEFRNLLQYGVEGVNYTLSNVIFTDENGVEIKYPYIVKAENSVYDMDVKKTGNVFLAYPDSAESVLEWEYGKQQNLEASTYPTLGIYLDSAYKLDAKSVCIINAVSKRMGEYLNTLTTSQAISDFYDEAAAANDNTKMAQLLLEKTNGDLSYIEGGVNKTFTEEELVAALNRMEEKKFVDDANVLQSPNALYNNWLVNSGVRG